MYEQHFGLAKPPFRITPDPEFFFPGGNRGAVLEALVYAVMRGEGIVKVVGEVGSGKTMLCRMLERELPPSCEIVYLVNPHLTPAEILHAIAIELGIELDPAEVKLKVMHALQEYVLAKHAQNARVIVFVEEAQGMPVETLEEIRLLSNLETTQEKLLQIVLFGQPELDDKLDLHEIRQLRERITHGFELAPFDADQIRDYVSTRIRASGYRGNELFTTAAIKELERHSRGLLRRINILADKALLAAFTANEAVVKPGHVRLAVRDSEFRPRHRARAALKRVIAAAGVVIVAIAAVWTLTYEREILPPASYGTGTLKSEAADGDRLIVEGPLPAPAERAAPTGAGDLRARDAIPERTAETAREFNDNRPVYPTVSTITGMVSIDHLAPLTAPRRLAPDTMARWIRDGE